LAKHRQYWLMSAELTPRFKLFSLWLLKQLLKAVSTKLFRPEPVKPSAAHALTSDRLQTKIPHISFIRRPQPLALLLLCGCAGNTSYTPPVVDTAGICHRTVGSYFP
jgi:hypothetical protein